jgi:hypothetical protein
MTAAAKSALITAFVDQTGPLILGGTGNQPRVFYNC